MPGSASSARRTSSRSAPRSRRDLAVGQRRGQPDQRPAAGARHRQRLGVDAGEGRRVGEQVGQARAPSVSTRRAVRGDEPAGDGAGAGDADLLADARCGRRSRRRRPGPGTRRPGRRPHQRAEHAGRRRAASSTATGSQSASSSRRTRSTAAAVSRRSSSANSAATNAVPPRSGDVGRARAGRCRGRAGRSRVRAYQPGPATSTPGTSVEGEEVEQRAGRRTACARRSRIVDRARRRRGGRAGAAAQLGRARRRRPRGRSR